MSCEDTLFLSTHCDNKLGRQQGKSSSRCGERLRLNSNSRRTQVLRGPRVRSGSRGAKVVSQSFSERPSSDVQLRLQKLPAPKVQAEKPDKVEAQPTCPIGDNNCVDSLVHSLLDDAVDDHAQDLVQEADCPESVTPCDSAVNDAMPVLNAMPKTKVAIDERKAEIAQHVAEAANAIALSNPAASAALLKSAACVAKEAESGNVVQEVQEVQMDVNVLRQKAKVVMRDAAKAGTLERIVTKRAAKHPMEEAEVQLSVISDEKGNDARSSSADSNEAEQARLANVAQGVSQAANAITTSNPVAAAALARAAACIMQEARTAEVTQAKGSEPECSKLECSKAKSSMAKGDEGEALGQAQSTGRLGEMLSKIVTVGEPREQTSSEPPYSPSMKALKVNVRDALTKAAEEGELLRMIKKAFHPAKAEAKDQQGAPLKVGDDDQPVWTKELLKDTLRQKLSQAASTGRLEDILSKARLNCQSDRHANKTTQERTDLETLRTDLKLKAAATFEKAAENGRLEEVFAKTKKHTQMADVRRKAVETLAKAAGTDALQAAFAKAKEKTEIADLKRMAMYSLVRAAQSGDLENAFMKVSKAKQLDHLRMKAREAFMKIPLSNPLREPVKDRAEQERKAKIAEGLSQASNAIIASNPDAAAALERAAACVTAEAQKVDSVQAQKVDSVQAKARAMFDANVKNGRLAEVLQRLKQAEQVDIDITELKVKAREALEKALADGQPIASHGRIEKAQVDIDITELKVKAREALEKALADGQPIASHGRIEKAQAPIEELKLKARKALLKGAANGQLSASLGLTKQPEKVIEDELNITDLKLRARQALLKSAANGQLSASLDRIEPPEAPIEDELSMTELKVKAREALEKALADGQLSASLGRTKQPEKSIKDECNMPELKLRLRQGFLKAAANGALSASLGHMKQPETPKEEDIQQLRLKACRALANVASTRSIDEALEVAKKTRSIESLRCKARETLQQAGNAGFFQQLTHTVSKSSTESVAVETTDKRFSEQSYEHQVVDDMTSLKLKARKSLLKLNATGGFAEVLERIKQPEKVSKKQNIGLPQQTQTEHEQAPTIAEMPSVPISPTLRSSPQVKSKRRIIGGITRAPTSTCTDGFFSHTSSRSGDKLASKGAEKEYKAISRLRKAVSMTALTLDLGADASTSASLPAPFGLQNALISPGRSASVEFTPIPLDKNALISPGRSASVEFTPMPLERCRAASLGSLQLSKSKASALSGRTHGAWEIPRYF